MTGPSSEQLREMAAAYALGALSDTEARAFAAWLESSPETQREVAELREVQALLALGSEGPLPPAGLRGRVLAHALRKPVAPSTPARSFRPAPSRWLPATVWIALAASIVALVGVSLSRLKVNKVMAAQDSVIAALRQNLATTDADRTLQAATLQALLAPGVTLTRLTAQGNAAPEIQLFYNRTGRTAIASAAHLAPSAAGRVYQLWFIPKSGKPIPSVTFTVDADGRAILTGITVPADQGLAAAAVTDEPAGGSPQPTTTPFLVGTL